MVKPTRPQLGATGQTTWAQFVHDGVVDPLLDDDGNLLPGVALPDGGVVGQVVTLGNDGPTWADGEGPQGASLEYIWDGTLLGVRVEGDETYTYVDLEGAKGDPGDEVEMQVTATHIQWRYVGGVWADLIALAELEGPKGDTGPQGPAWNGWEGAWALGATYALNDVVTFLAAGEDNAAAYVSLQDANTGNEPPAPGSAPDAWWDLVVRGGQDGEGAAGTATPATVTAPLQAGAVGGSVAFARQDHEHPSDGFEVAGAVTAHEGGADPHPGYLTEAEGNAAYPGAAVVTGFGAVGDGVADDTAAIQAAVDGANGRPVWFPSGTYRITSTVTLVGGTTLDLAPGATIDASGLPVDGTLFRALGTLSDAELLTSDASEGDETVAVADSSAFAVGDLVRVRAENRWSATTPKVGEFHYVASVSAGQVRLRDALWDDYTTAETATVEKVSPVSHLRVRGGDFFGSGPTDTQVFAEFEFCEDVEIEGVTVRQFGLQEIVAKGCVRLSLTDSHLGRIHQATANSYGITLMDGCQWVRIVGNHFSEVRAGVSSGGATGNYGIVRFVTVSGNTFYGILGGAVRAHANAQSWTITGNTITANESALRTDNEAILYRGIDGTISGNVIQGAHGAGIRLAAQAARPCRLTVTGNLILRCGREGIRVDTEAGASVDGLTISGNIVQEWAQVSGLPGIGITASGGPIENVTITGNTCTGPAQNARALLVRATADAVREGTLAANVLEGAGTETVLFLADGAELLERFAINGNRAYGGTYGIRAGTHQEGFFVAGNVATGSSGGLLGFDVTELGDNRTS